MFPVDIGIKGFISHYPDSEGFSDRINRIIKLLLNSNKIKCIVDANEIKYLKGDKKQININIIHRTCNRMEVYLRLNTNLCMRELRKEM